MRMSKEDFLFLKHKIEPLDTPSHRRTWVTNAVKTGDLDMRYRWDLLFASMRGTERANFYGRVYAYLNDDHIDTALRRIVAPL